MDTSATKKFDWKKLQWGRVTNDAEIMQSGSPWSGLVSLQWGRVTNDAEIVKDTQWSAKECFELQWGRVTNDAEIRKWESRR